MSTAQDLIDDALGELNVLKAGSSAGATDSAFCLRRLNLIVEDLNVEKQSVFAIDEGLYILAANTLSPTIGASGTFTATRPAKIEFANTIDVSSTQVSGTGATTGAGDKVLTDGSKNFTTAGVVAGRDLVYVVSGLFVTPGLYRISAVSVTTLTLATNPGSSGSSIVYRVILIPARQEIDCRKDAAWWARVSTRGQTGTPEGLFYNPSYPNGTLNLWPYNSSALGLELFTWVPFTAFSALSNPVSLPPAVYRQLMLRLADDVASPFGAVPSTQFKQKLWDANNRVASINSKTEGIISDLQMPFGGA